MTSTVRSAGSYPLRSTATTWRPACNARALASGVLPTSLPSTNTEAPSALVRRARRPGTATKLNVSATSAPDTSCTERRTSWYPGRLASISWSPGPRIKGPSDGPVPSSRPSSLTLASAGSVRMVSRATNDSISRSCRSAASLISGLLGDYLEAGAIMAIVILNAVLGIVQERPG